MGKIKEVNPSLYCPYCGTWQSFKVIKNGVDDLVEMTKLKCCVCNGIFWADPYRNIGKTI